MAVAELASEFRGLSIPDRVLPFINPTLLSPVRRFRIWADNLWAEHFAVEPTMPKLEVTEPRSLGLSFGERDLRNPLLGLFVRQDRVKASRQFSTEQTLWS